MVLKEKNHGWCQKEAKKRQEDVIHLMMEIIVCLIQRYICIPFFHSTGGGFLWLRYISHTYRQFLLTFFMVKAEFNL